MKPFRPRGAMLAAPLFLLPPIALFGDVSRPSSRQVAPTGRRVAPAGPVIGDVAVAENADSTVTITGRITAADPAACTVTFAGPDWLTADAKTCTPNADGCFSRTVTAPAVKGGRPASFTCTATATDGRGAKSATRAFVIILTPN